MNPRVPVDDETGVVTIPLQGALEALGFEPGDVITVGEKGAYDVVRPFPPLPTEANTVIKPQWKGGIMHTYGRLVLGDHDTWWVLGVAPWHATSEELRDDILGFEILSQPLGSQDAIKKVANRAFHEGVEAALNRIPRDLMLPADSDVLGDLRAEFALSSHAPTVDLRKSAERAQEAYRKGVSDAIAQLRARVTFSPPDARVLAEIATELAAASGV